MSTAAASANPSGFQPIPHAGGADVGGDASARDVWHRVRVAMKADAGDHSFEAWLAPLVLTGCDGDTWRLAAPSAFAADWVTSNFTDLLRRHWSQHQPIRRVEVLACTVPVGPSFAAAPAVGRAAAPADGR